MPTLRFTKDIPFKIVQFTDVHYTDDSSKDMQTLSCMTRVLEQEKPDLVLFTGDTVFGELQHDPRALLPKALSPVIEAKVKWALLFGNHDTQWGEATKADLYAIQQALPGCVTPPPQGATDRHDFVLPILAADGDEPAWELFCFDSGRECRVGLQRTWAYLLPEQLDWYRRRSTQTRRQYGEIPAMAFMHIPLPEHHDVWDRATCYGVRHEGVGCSKINSGAFFAMHEQGNIRGVFVGHDHINDYWGDWCGIYLGYGRITGYNTYPRGVGLSAYGLDAGARVFLLHEFSRHFDTYIVEQSGKVIYQQPEHKPELHSET